MAISVRTQQFYGVSGANPAAQNFTTTAADKAVALFYSAWESGLMSSLTVGGAAATIGAQQNDAGSDEVAGVWYYLNPPAGVTAFDWAYASTPSDGPAVWIVAIQADGSVSVIDADADADGTSTSVTSTSAVSDLCVACGFQFDAAATVGGAYVVGNALAANSSFNGQNGRPYARVATGATTNATSQLGVAQIIFRESGAPPADPVPPDTSRSTGVRSLTGVGLRPRRHGAIWSFGGSP